MMSAFDLDRKDPLASLRDAFELPEGTVYLDGNSLGALPKVARESLERCVRDEWGRDLITSWNKHEWIDLPRTVGAKIAPLIGAKASQVICCDSTSVNLFKLLSAALTLRPDRRTILVLDDDFPTDAYVAEGLASLLGPERALVQRTSLCDLAKAFSDDVAVLLMTQVNYRSGELFDMRRLTEMAHQAGALVLWDLSHSAGVVPMSLDDDEVDFAVGCGYKYLNGGPGAPSFSYVNSRHENHIRQPLTGWLGHRAPFDFSPGYEAASGVAQLQAGTPPILSMRSLSAAMEVYTDVSLGQLREKSLALCEFFIAGLDRLGLDDLKLITPREPNRRGSQLSCRHVSAWGIAQALIEQNVIVDFRADDIVRFGFAPLYNSFSDVERALHCLATTMENELYRDPRYEAKPKVT